MTKRLLHLMNYKPLGTRSFDDFILEYAKQGRERGWEVRFGFTAPPPPSMNVDYFIYDPADIRIEPCDVLQTSFHSVFEKPILKLKTSGIAKRLVVIDHSSGEGPRRGLLTPLRRLRGQRTGRIVDAVVAVSEFIAQRDRERVFLPTEKLHVVPNGIDLSRFPFQERRAGKHTIIAYAGQLRPEKGVRTLIEAMRSVTGILRIAGLGLQRGELESLANSYSLPVQFLGQVTDIAALYSEADIVVVPSDWAEAFGLVAIEAMACGAAVIVSDAGALSEVVGDTGVIFPKGNAEELSAKLKELIGEPQLRQRLAARGRQRVEEHFQLADCVRRHLDIVESHAPRH